MIVCSTDLSNLIKRSLECILDGSEQAVISLYPDHICIQSVDSLAVCMCTFTFYTQRFTTFDIDEEVQVRFKVRSVYETIKKFDCLVLETDGDSIWFTDNHERRYLLVESQDSTTYYSVSASLFDMCACFKLHPVEFSNIILELAVGGGHIEVSMDNYTTYWKTMFETGDILFETTQKRRDNSHYRVIKPAVPKISNIYLTKFLKQACNIANICNSLIVYVRPDGPMFLKFEMGSRLSEVVITLVPMSP